MKILSAAFIFLLLFKAGFVNAQNNKKLDSYLVGLYHNHVLPGFAVVVVKNGQLSFLKAYGTETINLPDAFTTQSISPIASLTKSMTAIAIMQLVQRNKVALDQRVVHYIPWFRTVNKELSDKITIRMLLDNTSGLTADNVSFTDNSGGDPLESFVKSLAQIYLTREPGSSYYYSNTGFSVAGLVVASVSGMSYESYIQRNIFDPLGMSDSFIGVPKLNGRKLLAGHYYGIGQVIPAAMEINTRALAYIPAGSMTFSTAKDMGKYLTALMNSALLTKKSGSALWTSYTFFPGLSKEDGGDNSYFGYGLGWMISTIEGRKIIHHGGSTGKASSYIMIDPVKNIAVCVLFNLDLSFINKYDFATGLNIVNNIMRVSSGLNISTYGLPLHKDTSLNHTLSSVRSSNKLYAGNYILEKGGDDWVYFGVNMSIYEDKKGVLIGSISRGKQIVNQFKIDILNQSTGITRNTALPEQIKFKITPDHAVDGLFFKNMEFIRVNMQRNSGYTTNVLGSSNICFVLPETWKVKKEENGFLANDRVNSVQMTGFIEESGIYKGDNYALDRLRYGQYSETQRSIHVENINGNQWTETKFAFTKDHELLQAFILRMNLDNRLLCFAVIGKAGDFTSITQNVVFPLISSVRYVDP
jgi:CubicO group peptidase (beta-lactamase class C family)